MIRHPPALSISQISSPTRTSLITLGGGQEERGNVFFGHFRIQPTFVPLTDDEINRLISSSDERGLVVAIDAEFVSLGFGMVEILEDGTKKVSRPDDLALARVSVVRGDEDSPLFGVPFIDHHIHIDEREVKVRE